MGPRGSDTQGEGGVRVVNDLAIFLLGVAVGILIHRLLMAFVLWTVPDTRCAYCKWMRKRAGRHIS